MLDSRVDMVADEVAAWLFALAAGVLFEASVIALGVKMEWWR